ncbi:hypothetical protein WME73_49685 [Sorangium sp. So ce302]|uniref:hypothetical protein n=1 Tax=Sorangium sp. So ce302 TaxID=3133297 RepID=UPI003F6155A8
MTRMKLLGLVMAGLALAACGGDDDGGDGGQSGGDLDSKQLGELTAAESQAVCDDIAGSFEISKEDMCDLEGLSATFAGEDCEAAKAECISSPAEPEPTGSCDTSGFAGCTATVAELKGCITATTNLLKAITCESSLEDLAQQPAACAAVSEKCPELSGAEGEGS